MNTNVHWVLRKATNTAGGGQTTSPRDLEEKLLKLWSIQLQFPIENSTSIVKEFYYPFLPSKIRSVIGYIENWPFDEITPAEVKIQASWDVGTRLDDANLIGQTALAYRDPNDTWGRIEIYGSQVKISQPAGLAIGQEFVVTQKRWFDLPVDALEQDLFVGLKLVQAFNNKLVYLRQPKLNLRMALVPSI